MSAREVMPLKVMVGAKIDLARRVTGDNREQ